MPGRAFDLIAAIRVLDNTPSFYVHAKDTQIYERKLSRIGRFEQQKYTD